MGLCQLGFGAFGSAASGGGGVAGQAVSLTVTPSTSTPAQGTPFTVTVTAKDYTGATATIYGGNVAITSTDGAATLPSNARLVAGTGTFSVTINTSGAWTVTATDTVYPTITGSCAVTTPSSLLTGLTATWPFDGNANDASGNGWNMTLGTQAPTFVTGKVGTQAVNFAVASSQFLGSNAAGYRTTFSPGASPEMEFTFWFKLNSTTNCRLFSKDDEAGNREWFCDLNGGNVRLVMFNSVGTGFSASSGVFTADGTWHFVDVLIDFANTRVGIATDAGAFTYTTYTGTMQASTGCNWVIGASSNASDKFADLALDNMTCHMTRLLTTAERAALWNGGAGKAYPF